MSKNKRKSDSEKTAEEKSERSKTSVGKGLRTGVATLTICSASFGAYYSPHFRAASSDWLERCRALIAKAPSFGVFSEESASPNEKTDEILAQAPSFRDFLTEEYGEDGARELLGIDEAISETAPEAPVVANAGGGFADYVVEETNALENVEAREVAENFDAASLSAIPESGRSFADYVAAENEAAENAEPQVETSADDAAPFPEAPDVNSGFANYGAAEDEIGEVGETQGVAENDAASLSDAPESAWNFDEAGASNVSDAFVPNDRTVNEEKARFAAPVDENETALTSRLRDEMAERGVGNPRIERWGGRFWRASGFATTEDGVATFCEAVDVDPTAAQRAALAKFNAARF